MMASLKGSKTEPNLKEAFAGESHEYAEKSHAGRFQKALDTMMS